MTQPQWITPQGLLGNLQSNTSYNINVKAIQPNSIVSYNLISGKLPNNFSLDITTGDINGTTDNLTVLSTYTFTIRAIDNYNNYTDRTFFININPIPLPDFNLTTGSSLFSTLDSVWIRYQIPYTSSETPLITLVSGELPPGLELSSTGLLQGYPNKVNISRLYVFTLKIQNSIGYNTSTYYITVDVNTNRNPTILNTKPLTIAPPPSDIYYGYYVLPPTENNPPYVAGNVADIGTYLLNNYFAFKINGYDFDNQVLTYKFNPNPPSNFPVGLSLDTNTGWITGYPASSIFDGYIDDNSIPGTYSGISGDILTVNTLRPNSLPITIGQELSWNNTNQNIFIIDDSSTDPSLTGAGGTGTYRVSYPLALPPTTIHCNPTIFEYDFTVDCTTTLTGLTSSTTTFKFRLSNTLNPDITWLSDSDLGVMYNSEISKLSINAQCEYDIIYEVVGGTLPPNLELTSDGTLVGRIAYQPLSTLMNLNDTYTFSFDVKAYNVNNPVLVSSTKTFTLTVKQEFTQPVETLYIRALPDVNDRNILNTLLFNKYITFTLDVTSCDLNYFTCVDTSRLSINDELIFTGNIFGGIKANTSYYVKEILSQTQFSISTTVNGATLPLIVTLSGLMEFNIIKRNKYGSITVTESDGYSNLFTCNDTSKITVGSEISFNSDTMMFGGIVYGKVYYVKEIISSTQFSISETFNGNVKSLITGNGLMNISLELIPDDYVYRINDPYFGVAKNVVYEHAFGVYANDVDNYVNSITKNHYWRRLTLGEIKTAVAKDENGNILYEVVYSDVIDNLVNNNYVSINKEITWPTIINLSALAAWFTSRADIYTSYVFLINNIATYYTALWYGTVNKLYPNSLENMRKQIFAELLQVLDSRLLPEWMTSQQSDGNTLGYIPAWVICYTKPGKSSIIKNNIEKNWQYKLNQINFEVDRFTIDKSNTFNYDINTTSSTNPWKVLPSSNYKVLTANVTGINVPNYLITADDISDWYVNMPITFDVSGGGILADTVYYVKSVEPTMGTFSISRRIDRATESFGLSNFEGEINGTTLTVSAVNSGTISVGQVLTGLANNGVSIIPTTSIVSPLVVNPDGTGTYQVSINQTIIPGTTITGVNTSITVSTKATSVNTEPRPLDSKDVDVYFGEINGIRTNILTNATL